MADIEKWITINGTHIPIIKGESRARAVANFIKSKREKKNFNGGYGSKEAIAKLRKTAEGSEDEWKRTPSRDDRKERNELLTSRDSAAIRAEKDKEQVDQALAYRKSLNRAIKGRAKTKEETDEARYVEYKNIEEKAKKELERAAGGKRANQTYLAARHADEKMTEKYKTRYWGDTPNKSYKLKTDKETPAKRTIKGVGKTSRMEAADKKYDEAYNALRKIEKGRNSDYKYLTAREYGELSERAGRKLDNAFANYERATTFNTKTPSANMTKTRLGNNAGVRVDGRIYKKITRGNQKGWYMDEGGLKFSPADMSQKISKAKTTRYYKKWSN